MNIEINLDLARKIARLKGGKCLTKDSLPKKEKYKWKCKNKHQWEACLSNIAGNKSKKGTWCPYCAGVKAETSWLERLSKVAKKKKGLCLSTKCENQNSKIKLKCKNNHMWEARASHVYSGSWCPKCAKNVPHNLKKFYEIAESKNGKCLSKKYINQKTFLKFICSEGHKWEAMAGNVVRNSWCPHCARNVRLSIEQLQKIAIERGGECLSKNYINANKKYKWKCINGHIWSAPYGAISTGSWCPICSEYIGEKITRLYFEKVFKMKFNKVHPKWLRDKKGDPWELDGLGTKKINGYKIAFEHQGIQHYQYTPMFHKKKTNFKSQIEKDKIRRKKCNENNVLLFEIPQMLKLTKLEELPRIVEGQFKKFELENNDFKFYQDINYSSVYRLKKHDEVEKIILEKGGKLLSTKIKSNKAFVEVKCDNNHTWTVVPNSIKMGTWCPFCSGKKVEGGWFKHYQEIAKSKGGLCLSKESDYIGARENLKWKCSEGHIWEATPGSIKGRTWCPICGIKKRSDSQRDDIEKMLILAKNKNGRCLSKQYVNTSSKLVWECDKKHIWEAIPTSIKRGSWCPHCYKLKRKVSKKNNL